MKELRKCTDDDIVWGAFHGMDVQQSSLRHNEHPSCRDMLLSPSKLEETFCMCCARHMRSNV